MGHKKYIENVTRKMEIRNVEGVRGLCDSGEDADKRTRQFG